MKKVMVVGRGSSKSWSQLKEIKGELMRKVMIDKIGPAAMYEQLAEECCELAQAALKAARMMRADNPPRKSPKEVYADLNEEVADVWICLRELDLKVDTDIVHYKEERFLNNWHNMMCGEETYVPFEEV